MKYAMAVLLLLGCSAAHADYASDQYFLQQQANWTTEQAAQTQAQATRDAAEVQAEAIQEQTWAIRNSAWPVVLPPPVYYEPTPVAENDSCRYVEITGKFVNVGAPEKLQVYVLSCPGDWMWDHKN